MVFKLCLFISAVSRLFLGNQNAYLKLNFIHYMVLCSLQKRFGYNTGIQFLQEYKDFSCRVKQLYKQNYKSLILL